MKAGDTATLTNNPTHTWDSESEWQGGSSLTNIVTYSNSNAISTVTAFNTTFSAGTAANVVTTGSDIKTPVAANATGGTTDFSGNTYNITTASSNANFTDGYVRRINVVRAGTITDVSSFIGTDGGNGQMQLVLLSDIGGTPGTVLNAVTVSGITSGPTTKSASVSWPISAGHYWIGGDFRSVNSGATAIRTDDAADQHGMFTGGDGMYAYNASSGSWLRAKRSDGTTDFNQFKIDFSFSQNASAASGMWTSPTYDSRADNAVSDILNHTGTFVSGTSSVTTLYGSNNADMSSSSTQVFNNLNGNGTATITGKRYWRVVVQLSTNDDRNTAVVSVPYLRFAIDHAAAPTSLDSLTISSTVPSGTSATVTIATSADNMTYSSFVAVGSATPARYSKVKIVLTTPVPNDVTASVSSATLNWTITGNLISSAIDTGTIPAGWDVFLASISANGGTILLEMRSASTSGGLTAATFYTVTNGNFPPSSVTPLKFVQWRATLTASANQLPQVDDVTINWFISNLISSIRVASLFYNRNYYLAAAEFGNTTNNVLLVFDSANKWRVFRGVTINTLSFFFNSPYYGSATVGKLVKFLEGTTDQGTNIEMVVETKAFVSPESERNPFSTLVAKKLYVMVGNTGATWNFYYSPDFGTNFYPLQDVSTGDTNIVTPSSTLTSSSTAYRLSPVYNAGNSITNDNIIWKAVTNDAFAASLHEMHPVMLVRAREHA
jgi:hypothetical protein